MVHDWAWRHRDFRVHRLPPSYMARIYRGHPIPPGHRWSPPPPALIGYLPVYPGYEYVVLGTALVLISIQTGLVQDVIFDVFPYHY